MVNWLERGLAANSQLWTIGFWHHLPYSKGSHDSDSEKSLVNMREHILPVLERHGVDLVLSGHSHSYEQSYLINEHDGDSSTFHSNMLINAANGRESDSGAYSKRRGDNDFGTVFIVAGSSGRVSDGDWNHLVMRTHF